MTDPLFPQFHTFPLSLSVHGFTGENRRIAFDQRCLHFRSKCCRMNHRFDWMSHYWLTGDGGDSVIPVYLAEQVNRLLKLERRRRRGRCWILFSAVLFSLMWYPIYPVWRDVSVCSSTIEVQRSPWMSSHYFVDEIYRAGDIKARGLEAIKGTSLSSGGELAS